MSRSIIVALALGLASLVACSTGGDSGPSRFEEDTYTPPADTGGHQPDTAVVDTAPQPDTVTPDTTPETTCESQCEKEWAKGCFGAGYRICEDPDDDGCFTWSDLVSCPVGTACVEGECVQMCANQPCTVAGAHKCDVGDVVLECNDYDGDGCLEWGNPIQCPDGLVCAGGFCATSCASACTVMNATKCEGNAVVTCGDYNGDGCLEWGMAADCGDKFCSSGHCELQCDDECTVDGARLCEGNAYKTCADTDMNGCLEWGTPVNCGLEQICSGGACLDTCESTCSVAGAKKCEAGSQTQYTECDDYNDDGCLEWGSPLSCEGDLLCSFGHCVSDCQDACTEAGAKVCELNAVVECNDYNQDGCLDLGTPAPCEAPTTCSAGACVTICGDDCDALNQKHCVAASQTQFAVCGDYDDDSCLEWGSPEECGDGLVCASGNCALGCDDECDVVDHKQCDGDAVVTCGEYDGDECLEWGTPSYCELWEACQGGACAQQPPPVALLINEVLYDGTGGDDSGAFVELRGPAGAELEGFSLVGVNGNGDGDYNPIALSGTLGADGLFLIAHPDGDPAVLELADATSALVDFENGPDSVQLRYGATVADALGYGSFGADHVFAGEGSPAMDVVAGHSLGRNQLGTDSDDNAADFLDYANPTPGAANVMVNEEPTAALSCPTSGSVAELLSFDAAASFDPDGTIVDYAFDFGDGASTSGGLASVEHAYGTIGSFDVTLTVTDDGGATDSASCSVSVGDEDVPTVTFIKPVDGKQVTQGDTVAVLVDAEPAPGREIVKVTLLADGAVYGAPDMDIPYEFTYTVPVDQPLDTTIGLQASALDSVGSTGFAQVVSLSVKNDAPVASFTAVVTGALVVSMDASACFDTETPTEELEVRWDFTNDGTWDTDWSLDKNADHTFPSDGTYTIRLGVRDAMEQIDTTTREVTLSSIQYLSGEVTTTTWTGTIMVTGDVTVPAGNTLTISAGTSVLFMYTDQMGDGVGDYDIVVNGTLIVEGTAEQPVLFTALGAENKAPKAWNRIKLNGSGHQISHATIEYADVGIEVMSEASLTDSKIRFNELGIKMSSGALTLDGVTLRENVTTGMTVLGGTATVTDSLIEANASSGLYVMSGTLNVSGSEIMGNERSGIEYWGGGSGLVTQSLITANHLEGVRVVTANNQDPTPVIQYNNIYGNAVVAARVVEEVGILASQSNDYGTKTSVAWSTPDGESVDMVWASYSESDSSYSNYYTGSVRAGSSGATTLISFSTATSGWRSVESHAPASLVAQVNSNTYSNGYSGTCSVARAAYDQAGVARELSVITKSHRLDARHNFWGEGVFPDVLDVVTVGDTNRANVEGFVGEAFDETWDKGIYFGGEALEADAEWIGDVIVTGQLDVTGDKTLTIGPGVTVSFGCVDADSNGIGDCDIEVNGGHLVVNGAAETPVTFTDDHESKSIKSWHRVRVTGNGDAAISHAVFEYADRGLQLESGSHTLDHITAQNNEIAGLYITSASDVTVTGLTAEDNVGDGVYIYSSSNVSIDKAPGEDSTISDNGGRGVYVQSSTSAIQISNVEIKDNADAGVYVKSASPVIDHAIISQNLYGVLWSGQCGGSLTYSDVKLNQREGIFLASDSSHNPDPTINDNNIFANSVDEGSDFEDPGLSASQSNNYGKAFSSEWSPDNGAVIEFVRVSYTESDSSYSNYYTASLKATEGSSATLWSASTSSSAKLTDISAHGATRFRAEVNSNTYSNGYSGTVSVNGALFYRDASGGFEKELAAVTNAGMVDCKDNHWGLIGTEVVQLPGLLTLSRPDAIDYSGQVGSAVSGTGPQ